MLGNDIVDLRDADARPESFHARFDERVFSAEEQQAITGDANSLARRWAHWAAKEAAYKLARQFDSTFVFSPRRLVARFYNRTDRTDDRDAMPAASAAPVANDVYRSTRVRDRFERRGYLELPCAGPQGIRMLELKSFETAERVHVVAIPLGSDWAEVEMAIEAPEPRLDDPSAAVRSLAIRGISRSLGIAEERLRIAREGRIPSLELDGFPTPLCLSFSHHGRWVSYAMQRRADLQSRSLWTLDVAVNTDSMAGANRTR